MSEVEKQDGWTLLVDPGTTKEIKYRGIRKLRSSELHLEVAKEPHEAPFIVIVTYEDTAEFWAVKERRFLNVLEAYLDTNREPGFNLIMNILSTEDMRPVNRRV